MRNLSSQSRIHGFLRHPTLHGVLSKSPFGANSKAWELTALSQPINRARVNSEPPAQFPYRQDFIVNHRLVRASGRVYCEVSLDERQNLWSTRMMAVCLRHGK